jgi:hypothetical protein
MAPPLNQACCGAHAVRSRALSANPVIGVIPRKLGMIGLPATLGRSCNEAREECLNSTAQKTPLDSGAPLGTLPVALEFDRVAPPVPT